MAKYDGLSRRLVDPDLDAPQSVRGWRWFAVFGLLVGIVLLPGGPTPATAATLLEAHFDTGTDGFTYVDDAFLGTNQPSYASGVRQATGGFGGSGGLEVTLGGVNGNTITGMSGAWNSSFNLAVAATGLRLRFRYKLQQSATYEFDEYSRMLATMDGNLLGRGDKTYIDHVGGDGSSGQGNSSSYLPTTDWQEHEVYIASLAAGSHTLRLGGYNNAKNAADETTTVVIDDVTLTDGQTAPVATAAETLADLVDINRYKSDIQTLAGYGDRCRMTSCPGSPANSFFDAQDWVSDQLTGWGYTPQIHTGSYGGLTVSNLYATKIGTVHPDQMYIVSGHLDGRGAGGGADDDASGSSVALELARILALPDVRTNVSVRFIFWDREEQGLNGSNAYVTDRMNLQGVENPSGSGLYPEPTWLGMIQHDMVLYDHGAGTPGGTQSTYADMDVEWRAGTTMEAQSRALALTWHNRSGVHSAQFPSTAYSFSTNSDDTPFHPWAPSISVRENRRSLTSGSNAEWINPNYHTANDLYTTYSAADFNLGYNIARVTTGMVAELAGVTLVGRPTADAQSVLTAKGVAMPIVLTGADPDGESLTFAIVGGPQHGTLSGTAPNLVYTPSAGYFGLDAFAFTSHDGVLSSAPATVSISVAGARHFLPFTDNFDTDRGWVSDFFGTDSANAGRWERGDPGPTDSDGPKQLGLAASEVLGLITGARSGFTADGNDVDGGVTSLLSPALVLPAGEDIALSFAYYLAHGRNTSADDYLRVRVVGDDDVTVLEERGAPENDDAAWQTATVELGAFAGQTVTLRIDAADLGRPSLIEAAIDDVSVVTTTLGATVLQADFDGGADGFVYADDPFRGSGEPAYASGVHAPGDGHEGGGIQVQLGGLDGNVVTGMSGGWQKDFILAEPGSVLLSFWYRLTQSPDYEPDEFSDVLASIDGTLVGLAGADVVHRVYGNGNGGIAEGTGWRPFAATIGPLPAGTHSLVLGGFNSGKSYSNETTEVLLDQITVRLP